MEIKSFLKETQTDKRLGFFNTFKKIILSPANFFDNLKDNDEYTLSPIKFLFLYLIFTSIIGLPFFILQLMADLGVNITLILYVIGYFVLVIILGFIFIFIQIGVTHIFFKLFRGIGKINSTLQIICYGIAPSIIGSIPIVGLIGMIYSLIIMTKGGRRLHEINAFLSFLAIILPFVIFMVIGVVIGIMVGGFSGLG